MDEISLFDKALSALEVENIYNDGIPTDLTGRSNLLCYWTFNDGSTADDTSGNGHDGVLTGTSHSPIVPF